MQLICFIWDLNINATSKNGFVSYRWYGENLCLYWHLRQWWMTTWSLKLFTFWPYMRCIATFTYASSVAWNLCCHLVVKYSLRIFIIQIGLAQETTFRERGTSTFQSTKNTFFGFAFVDAAAGRFYVGSLEDDSPRSALCSLLTQVLFLKFRSWKFMHWIGKLTCR
jgi:hypothetical protein